MYNGEVMFSTQDCASRSSAVNAIGSITKNGPGAPTVEAEQQRAWPQAEPGQLVR